MYICRSYLKRKSYQSWWRLVVFHLIFLWSYLIPHLLLTSREICPTLQGWLSFLSWTFLFPLIGYSLRIFAYNISSNFFSTGKSIKERELLFSKIYILFSPQQAFSTFISMGISEQVWKRFVNFLRQGNRKDMTPLLNLTSRRVQNLTHRRKFYSAQGPVFICHQEGRGGGNRLKNLVRSQYNSLDPLKAP